MEVKGWKGKYLSYSMVKSLPSQENLIPRQLWLPDDKERLKMPLFEGKNFHALQ
jgi:hypothetical protein